MTFTPYMLKHNGGPTPEAFKAKELYPWLPIGYRERELYKHCAGSGSPEKLLMSMQAQFARSLEACDYDFEIHATWYEYAKAYLADTAGAGTADPGTVEKVAQLLGVFPEASPCLDGGYWRAPAVQQDRAG